MRSIGIDIGSSSIKVVEVVVGKKGLVVTKFFEHPLGTNPAFDPEIEIIEFLRSLLPTFDPATTKICMAMKQEQVSSRLKNFPFSDRTKILKLLPNELEEDLPFSMDSAIYDFKMVRTLGTSAEILAVASPKHRIESALTLFRSAGLEPSILSCEAIALANCFEKWQEAPPAGIAPPVSLGDIKTEEKQLNLNIYIGHSKTQVLVFHQDRLITVRTILWGAKNIADSIARKYEIPYIEALKEMRTKAFILLNKDSASYDQVVFSDTIAAQVREVARDIKITLLEIKSEFNALVENITLSGGGSAIQNLNAFLTQILEIPVNKTQVLRGFSIVQFEPTPRIDSVIGVALGLAIEGLKKPRNPAINLLKGEFALQNLGMQKFWERWRPTLQLAAAVLIVFFVYSFVREEVTLGLSTRTEDVLKSQAKAVARLGSKQANEKGVKTYISTQRKRSKELMDIASIAKMNSALDIFKKISEASPAKASLKLNVRRLLIQDDSVRIEGFVSNNQQLGLFKNALTGIAVAGKIEQLSPSTLTANEGASFALAFKVDRGTK